MAISIIKGADAPIVITLTKKETNRPFDLTGFTGASATFEGDSGNVVKECTVLDDCGQLQCSLADTDTELLKAGDGKNMEVVIDQGTVRTIVQFEGVLDVKERLF